MTIKLNMEKNDENICRATNNGTIQKILFELKYQYKQNSKIETD